MLQRQTLHVLAVHGGYVLREAAFGTLLVIPSTVKKYK